MAPDDSKKKPIGEVRAKVPSSCPHCGVALSPWQQVLLNVDRALMCKHCWYRIILDVTDKTEDNK